MAPAEANFQLSSFLFLPKHPFILRLSFLLKTPRFIRVLSKMEYILIIQNATSKMADVFSSLFRNKWRHHDITAIVKNHLCVSQLPLFYQRPYFLCIFRFKSTLREIWILPIYSTIWRQITLPCQFNFAPNLKLKRTSLCVIFLAVGWVVLKLQWEAYEAFSPVGESKKSPVWIVLSGCPLNGVWFYL